ncbi:hypothetical protein lerEdw1_006426 [Lerista edwardsae]|nr:hypothetical protein lerEdw1_006426 [Lerista edwardsae]
MERGDSSSLVPFAKQSRTVSRDQPNASSADFSNCNVWNKLGQQSNSSPWTEDYYNAPPLLTSGWAVQRPAKAEVESFPWQRISSVQKLPPPKELCQRKKRGLKRKSLASVRAVSVCYHLEELKRRQSNIDELKKAKWGGLVPQPLSEEQEGVDHPLRKAKDCQDPLGLFSMPRQAGFCEKDSVFTRRSTVQFLYPEWKPTVGEKPEIPPGNPLLSSCTRAAQERDPVATGCLPEEDFAGFRIQLEE